MQVLKEDLKDRILEVALMEFSDNGFENASLRSIAKNSGMTVGNLYRYFKHKEDLFYNVITPAYSKLMILIEKSIEFNKRTDHTGCIEHLADLLLKIHSEHRKELLIIFEGSKGTRYEKTRKEIVSLLEGFLKELFKSKVDGWETIIEDDFLFNVIAAGFIDGLIMIAKHYEGEENIKKLVPQFIAFYFKNLNNRLNYN